MAINNSINANSVTPLSPTNGGLGVSNPTAHGILVGEGSSAVTSKVLAANEILVGQASADPVNINFTKMQAPFNFMMMGA